MNRRPSKSRSGFDSFSPRQTAHLRMHTPDAGFFEKKKKKRYGWRILLSLLLAAAVLFGGNFLANQFVWVRRVTVPVKGLNEAFDGFTLLHVSDLKGARFGSAQGMVDFALNGKEFDVVVMTGDMVSPLGNAQPLYALLDCLRAMDKDVPIYYIAGDGDPLPTSMTYASGGSPFAPWVLGASQRGAQLLSSPVSIERDGQRIWLAATTQLSLDLDGMQGQYEQQYLAALGRQDENEIEMTAFQLNALESLRSARALMSPDDIYIALTHVLPGESDPDALTPASLPRSLHLLLGGHYLGGLMCLPALGPLFIPSNTLPNYGLLPGKENYSGLTRRGSTWLYASPGLGSKDAMYPEWFFRLANPPTVTLITLTPSAL